MATIIAKLLESYPTINEVINRMNNGSTSSCYLYENNGYVTYNNPYGELSEELQTSTLEWFLEGKKFELIKE